MIALLPLLACSPAVVAPKENVPQPGPRTEFLLELGDSSWPRAAGDFDGDGVVDFLLSRTGDEYDDRDDFVTVFQGDPAGGWNTLTLPVPRPGLERFGRDLRTLGDVNGDGFGDAAVVAEIGDERHIALYAGGPDGLTFAQWLEVEGDDEYWDTYRSSDVEGPGDLDGDGYADVVVVTRGRAASSEISIDDYPWQPGQLVLFRGSPDALVGQEIPLGLEDPVRLEGVASTGDVDHDGRPDLSVTGYQLGLAACNWPDVETLPLGTDLQPDERQAAFAVGDLDGDGRGELSVDRWAADSFGNLLWWHRFLVFDGADGLGDPIALDELSVGPVGDLDGDGFADLSVSGAGQWIARGGPDGPALEAPTEEDPFAAALGTYSPAGDVDGDGRDDLLNERAVDIWGTSRLEILYGE